MELLAQVESSAQMLNALRILRAVLAQSLYMRKWMEEHKGYQAIGAVLASRRAVFTAECMDIMAQLSQDVGPVALGPLLLDRPLWDHSLQVSLTALRHIQELSTTELGNLSTVRPLLLRTLMEYLFEQSHAKEEGQAEEGVGRGNTSGNQSDSLLQSCGAGQDAGPSHAGT